MRAVSRNTVRCKSSPLGLIPKEWAVESVDECFNLLRNNTFSRAMLDEQPGQICNVHYGDVLIKYDTIIDCNHDRLPSLRQDVRIGKDADYAQDGDLIFADTAEDDTVGKAVELVNVGNLKIVSGLHTIFMRPKERRFASKWLGYFVNSGAFHSQLLPFVVGSKVSSISRGNIKRAHVLIPTEDTQRRIVEILSTCDEVITRSRAAVEKLRKIKAGMLNDFFTRGIDDDSRLRPQPQQAPKLYKDSPLGPIPKEWEVKRLGDVCEVQLGKMLDAAKNVGVEKPYLGNKAVQWGRFDLAAVEKVRLTEEDLRKFRLQKDDLLVCEGGEVGRCAIWNDELPECYYQKAIHRVRLCDDQTGSVVFLANVFAWYADNDRFRPYVTQTSIAHLPKEKLEEVALVWPEKSEQDCIALRLSAIDERIATEERVVAKYRSVKAGLMQRLLLPPGDAEVVDETILEAV